MANWWNNPLAENPMGYNALQEMEAASGLNNTDTYQGTDRLQSVLDVASLVPGVGDIAGPLADLRMMQQNPEQRTLANIALFGLGALPAIPSLAFLMSRGGGLSRAIIPFSNESGVIGYHGTRADFPTEEAYPLTHYGLRPNAAHERLTMGPNGEVPDYIIQDFLTAGPGRKPGYSGTNIKRVDLNIKNPLRIVDEGGGHENVLEYMRLVRNADGVTKNEYKALEDIYNNTYELTYKQTGFSRKAENEAERVTREALIKHLESKGYDGFVYKNEVEDKGVDSLIPFRNNQVENAYGRDSKYGTYNDYHHLGSNGNSGNQTKLSKIDAQKKHAGSVYKLKLGLKFNNFSQEKNTYKISDAQSGEVLGYTSSLDEVKQIQKFLKEEAKNGSGAPWPLIEYQN